MADTLATTFLAKLSWSFQEGLDLSTVIDAAAVEYNKSLADGTAASTADKIWHDSRAVAGAANDDLDLNALTNSIFGSTVTINLVKVRGLFIVNTNTATGESLVIDTSLANSCTGLTGGASGKISIPADSCLLMTNKVDGWACTNGSLDKLRITNTTVATSITYKIVIVGTSA